jgi:hypothetical protein
MRVRGLLSIAVVVVALTARSVFAAPALFADNFETNSGSYYSINADPDTQANFAYDYSAMGIPSAPNSSGGTTRGLQLKANSGDATGTPAAISISPIGGSFTGDIIVRFDVWMNTNGPFPEGGSGSNHFFTAGVGNSGLTVQKNSASANGAWFAADDDGFIGSDYRAYFDFNLFLPESGVYAAGTDANARSADHAYYHGRFPGGQEPPVFQQTQYPQQTGPVKPGALAMAWQEVSIKQTANANNVGTNVTWSIDGLPIASFENYALSHNNIFVGYWDVLSSVSDPTLAFGIIDNLVVEPIPEPSSAALMVGALLTAVLARRRSRTL